MFVSTATVCYVNCCSVLLRDCPVWHSHVYQPSCISVANQTQEGGFILLFFGGMSTLIYLSDGVGSIQRKE